MAASTLWDYPAPTSPKKFECQQPWGKALFASAHENEFEVREVMPEAFANDLNRNY
jgi:hypothetical protein